MIREDGLVAVGITGDGGRGIVLGGGGIGSGSHSGGRVAFIQNTDFSRALTGWG